MYNYTLYPRLGNVELNRGVIKNTNGNEVMIYCFPDLSERYIPI